MKESKGLAALLAADIVETAEQYPEIRGCESFAALHDIYDANESIIAALNDKYGRDGWDSTEEACCDEVNAATDALDAVLDEEGFAGLVKIAKEAG